MSITIQTVSLQSLQFGIHKDINQQLEDRASPAQKDRGALGDSSMKIPISHSFARDQILIMNLHIATPTYMGDQQEDALAYSFIASKMMDIYQTGTWGQTVVNGRVRGKVRELNPIAALFTKTGQHPAIPLLGSAAIIMVIESIRCIKDRPLRLAALSALSIFAGYITYFFNTRGTGRTWQPGDYGNGVLPDHARMMQIHIPFSLRF